MSLIEFIEGLARVAEKLSPSSPSYEQKNLTEKKRRVLPLFVKFEGLIFILYNRMKSQLPENFTKLAQQSFLETNEARKMGISELKNENESENLDESELSL
jgi:hypothetical protein